MKNKEKYFVLFDSGLHERFWRSDGIYDQRKDYSKFGNALKFAGMVLSKYPILVKLMAHAPEGNERVKDAKKPYLVVAYFKDKYHYDKYITGCDDPVPNYEIKRCSKDDLEGTIKETADEKETPDKIYWGLELKVLS